MKKDISEIMDKITDPSPKQRSSAAPVKKPETKKEIKSSQIQEIDYSQSIISLSGQIPFLQRNIGNKAVGRLIRSGVLQTKFKMGQPGDKYEQEADKVAEQVMWLPELAVVAD